MESYPSSNPSSWSPQRYISALRTIVFSIISTLGSVFWTSLLLVLLFFLFGVLIAQIAPGPSSEKKYGKVVLVQSGVCLQPALPVYLNRFQDIRVF